MNKLLETLRPKDLEYLIDDIILIDKYTSKANADNITIAISVNDEDAGNELLSLINKIFVDEVKDSELSYNINKHNNHLLFVELDRNKYFYETLNDIVDMLTRLTNNKKWYFKSETDEKFELNKENILTNIRLNQINFKNIKKPESNKKEEEIKEFLETGKYKKKGNVLIIEDGYDRYKLQIEKFINESEFENYVINSYKCDYSSYMTLLESFPFHEFIETDDKLFLQRDNKILMLKFL